MNRRSYLTLTGTALAGGLAGCAGRSGDGDGDPGDGGGGDGSGPGDGGTGTPDGVALESVTTALSEPWGLAPLPDGRLLVTERPGRLRLVDPAGDVREVPGTPSVFARGQGGLLDVALHPDFPDERWVYLTYSAADDEGRSSTHLGRGRLSGDATELAEFELLHAAEPFVQSSGHFGSRVAFRDGHAYVTVGDRQFKDFGPDHVAQDLGNELGTVLRLRPDGSVPADNPFVDDPDARDAIYSYGHRNAQGLAVHPETGDLWESEFGERDGDEINVIEAGANYGWPVADEGCRYGTDQRVGVPHDERDDVTAPVVSWPCGSGGFPPSGTTFYDGPIEAWQGDLFVGGLASQYLARFAVEGREATERDPLLAGRGWRVRTVAVGPEGALYAATDGGRLVRFVAA